MSLKRLGTSGLNSNKHFLFNLKLRSLVLNSFSKWKKVLKTFHSHAINLYHKKFVESAEHFLSVQRGLYLQSNIVQQIDVALKNRLKRLENKKKLRRIVNTII